MLLTFDLDGVIMKNPFGSGVFPTISESIAEDVGTTPQAVRQFIVEEAKRRLRSGERIAAYNWDDIAAVTAAHFGSQQTFDVASLVESFCYSPHIGLYPHGFELLQELHSSHYTLRALTNGFAAYQRPVLKALGVLAFFEQVLTPEVVGAIKPEAEFYEASRRGLQANEPHLHIGDTIIHDVWGAKQVQAIAIWVQHDLPEELLPLTPRERAQHPSMLALAEAGIQRDMCPEAYPDVTPDTSIPDYLIHSLAELRPIIASYE